MTNTKFARFGGLLAASLFAATLPALGGCAAPRAEKAASTQEFLAGTSSPAVASDYERDKSACVRASVGFNDGNYSCPSAKPARLASGRLV